MGVKIKLAIAAAVLGAGFGAAAATPALAPAASHQVHILAHDQDAPDNGLGNTQWS
ncbi:MAG TPA: hypothetical protein VH637_00365 [Streptosporangiaceae bacterium]|jgi:hypothetical protein